MSAGSPGDLLPHVPVLYQAIITALQPRGSGRYVDGTVGAGGHAAGILEASAPDGELLGLDVDPQAIALARERLAPFNGRAILVQESYATLLEQLQQLGWDTVDGVLLDLGASSMQFDTPGRGFSFQAEAPLDMRFDPGNPVTAETLVNQLPERELADLLFRYGEERRSRQVARAIVQRRPLHTTTQLAQVVSQAAGSGSRSGGRGRAHIHPATRTFQALRIAVNGELDALASVLPQAVAALKPGGRLAVISFHSLEDRIVKQFIQQEARDCICPPQQPVCTCGHHATLQPVRRKPIEAGAEEVAHNPRARSARLRVAERLPAWSAGEAG